MATASSPRALPLPSLHALQVFDVAAQHLSFTAAAQALNVTQTAVSHQIRSLESELGVVLFRRTPRRLALTPAGEAWASELRAVFARLHALNQRLRAGPQSERPVVALSTLTSFGSRWLVPRLGRFLDRHPEIDLRISASEQLVDFAREPFDLGIRFGSGRYPGLATEKLADDAWIAVCAPSYLAKHKLKSPADLARHPLLRDDHLEAWPRWFEALGASVPERARYLEFTDSSMLVEATVQGQGVGLARRSLAVDELATGRLVLAFPRVAPLSVGLSYYLVGPRENFRRPEVAAFRAWIHKEAVTLKGAQ
jgi:LysR family transcriptional regulator, glycine cleavage system transcriptional activator